LAIEYCSKNLKFVSSKKLTEEMCLLAVKKFDVLKIDNNIYLNDIPKEKRTRNVCLESLRQQVFNIQDIPEEFKTADFYLEALDVNPYVLQIIPEEYKTEEIYIKAVQNDERNIRFVPEHLKESVLRRKDDLFRNLSELPSSINIDELEDPVMFEKLEKDKIYGFFIQNEKWYVGISHEVALKFIVEKFHDSNKQKIFIPTLNSLYELEKLRWVKI
jgi:hypothetical protein